MALTVDEIDRALQADPEFIQSDPARQRTWRANALKEAKIETARPQAARLQGAAVLERPPTSLAEIGQSPTGQFLKQAALPTLGAAGGAFLGGMTGPAAPFAIPALEAMGSMGGEFLNQRLGISPESTTQIGLAGAMPPIARLGMKGLQMLPRALPGASAALQEAAATEARALPSQVLTKPVPSLTEARQALEPMAKTFVQLPRTRQLTQRIVQTERERVTPGLEEPEILRIAEGLEGRFSPTTTLTRQEVQQLQEGAAQKMREIPTQRIAAPETPSGELYEGLATYDTQLLDIPKTLAAGSKLRATEKKIVPSLRAGPLTRVPEQLERRAAAQEPTMERTGLVDRFGRPIMRQTDEGKPSGITFGELKENFERLGKRIRSTEDPELRGAYKLLYSNMLDDLEAASSATGGEPAKLFLEARQAYARELARSQLAEIIEQKGIRKVGQVVDQVNPNAVANWLKSEDAKLVRKHVNAEEFAAIENDLKLLASVPKLGAKQADLTFPASGPKGGMTIEQLNTTMDRLQDLIRNIKDPAQRARYEELYKSMLEDVGMSSRTLPPQAKQAMLNLQHARRRGLAELDLSTIIETQGIKKVGEFLDQVNPNAIANWIKSPKQDFWRKSLEPGELKAIDQALGRWAKIPTIPVKRGAPIGSGRRLGIIGLGAGAGGMAGGGLGAGLGALAADKGAELIAQALMSEPGRKALIRIVTASGGRFGQEQAGLLAAHVTAGTGAGAQLEGAF